MGKNETPGQTSKKMRMMVKNGQVSEPFMVNNNEVYIKYSTA